MEKKVSFFSAILRKVEIILALLAGGIVIFTMILVSLDVFLRNFFNSPIPGVYEMVGFLFVSAVALGLSYTQAERAHININIVTRYFSGKFQKFIVSFGYLIGIIVLVILVWQNATESWGSFVVQDFTMGIVRFPLWPAKATLTLGLGVLLIRFVYDFITIIKDKKFEEDHF
ncbi:TRAP transporter small permease [Virgibacillus kimchii]